MSAPSEAEAFAEVLHDAYEAAAVEAGWETQARSRKPWADVPEANKATMLAALTALLASPAMAERDARVRAEALREAADRIMGPNEDLRDTGTCRSIALELRDLADQQGRT